MLDTRIEGMQELEEGLGALKRALTPQGMRQLLSDFGVVIEQRIARAFREQRAPEEVADIGRARQAAGQPWKPLAPSTIAARRGGGAGPRILRDTGRLSQSIGTHVGPDYVEVGTGEEIGVWQHGGTDPYPIVPVRAKMLRFIGAGGEIVFARRVDHPGLDPRPFVGIDERDVQAMLDQTLRHLEAAIA